MPDHIILKLSRYLENSTNNMIPTQNGLPQCYFQAGQCASPLSQRNHGNAKNRHTRLHSSHTMAPGQSRFESCKL